MKVIHLIDINTCGQARDGSGKLSFTSLCVKQYLNFMAFVGDA